MNRCFKVTKAMHFLNPGFEKSGMDDVAEVMF
jgi:hypothetical protein